MYKIKRFSVLSEKEFGEVKRANKVLKNNWVNSQITPDYRSVLGSTETKAGKLFQQDKAGTINSMKLRFQKDVASELKSGELVRKDIPGYGATGIDELRETRRNISKPRVQGARDMASQDINSRINSRANGGQTGKDSYTYEQQKKAEERVKQKSTVNKATSTPKPTAPTTSKVTPPKPPVPSTTTSSITEKTVKNGFKLGKGGKIALAAGGLLSAGAGLAYGINRLRKDKE